MHQPGRFVASLTGVNLTICSASVLAHGSGTAAPDRSTMVPLGSSLKRCDSSNCLDQQYFRRAPATRELRHHQNW